MADRADRDTGSSSAPPFGEHLDATYRMLLLLLLVCTPLVVWELTGIPKPAIKQAFGELLTALMAILWILKMNETGKWKLRVSVPGVAIALFLITQILSIIVAANRGHALRSVRSLAFPALLYLVTLNNVKGAKTAQRYLAAVAVSAFVVSVYGIIQSTGMDFMGWCKDQGACILAPSSFESAAAVADFLVIAFPLTVALIFYAQSLAGKMSAAAVAILILLHLRLTARPESFIALEVALAAALVVAWTAHREKPRAATFDARRFGAIRLVASVLCILIALGATHALTLMRSRSEALGNIQRASQTRRLMREAAWECATRMTVAHPILGTGTGSYELASPLFWNDTQKRWFAQSPGTEAAVENEYLRVAAESGAPGLAAYLLIVSLSCTYFLAACKRNAAGRTFYLAMGTGCALVAVAANSFFSASFQEPAVLFTYFFLLAMIEILARGEETTRSVARIPAGRSPLHYLVWTVLIPVTLLLVPYIGRPLAYYQHLSGCREYKARGLYTDAKREYLAASRIYPSAWEPHILQASVLAGQGKMERATALYGKVLELHPNHVVALVQSANAFLKLHVPEQTIILLEKAVRLNPDVAAARYGLGEAYAAQENWAAALENFNAAERYGFPDLPGLYFNQYRCMYHLGQYSEADERLDALVRRDPQDPKLWYEIGLLELKRDRATMALTALNKALSLSDGRTPKRSVRVGIHHQLALLYLQQQNDVAMALQHAARAVKIAPRNKKVRRLAASLARAAQSDRVRAENAHVLPQFLYNVGASLRSLFVGADPVPFLEEAATLAQGRLPTVTRDAHVLLAEHNLKRSFLSAAQAHLDVAERVDPFDHNIFRVRGDIYAAMYKTKEAREAYLAALHIQPADEASRSALLELEGLDTLGGDTSEAVRLP